MGEYFEPLNNAYQEKEDGMEEIRINNTAAFDEAIAGNKLEAAEAFLEKVKNNRELYPQYDERWIDHRERELFRALRDKGDRAGAVRIAENSIKPSSREGRLKNLKHVFKI